MGVALTVVASIIYENKIEAVVIDDRLHRIANNPTPSSIRSAAKLVSVAISKKLVLSRDAVGDVVMSLDARR